LPPFGIRSDSLSEEALSRDSLEYAERRAIGKINADDVALALAKGGLYLDFMEYTKYDYDLKEWTKERRYLAFLLRQDGEGKAAVEIEDLGPSDQINDLISKLRKLLHHIMNEERGVGGIRITDASTDVLEVEKSINEVSPELYERLLSPFGERIVHASVLCVAPSGNLNLMPFEVLTVSGKGDYLCDRTPIIYALGRDLYAAKVRKGKVSDKDRSHQVCIIAGPDYSDVKGVETRVVSSDRPAPRALARGVIRGWPITFESLPGTLDEAKAINRTAASRDVVALLGNKASETSLKHLSHPKTFHLATHGYLLEDKEHNVKRDEVTRDVGGVSPTMVQPVFRGDLELKNPLLRSGLALAGANRWAHNIAIPHGEDDGILTAMEVTGLDFFGTDLVVLSACETGLGEIQRGEGVSGLRRAFKIAGAENIIMSLWSVPDQETVWLMEAFYEGYFGGEKPALALNKARADLRKRLVERDGFDHPYYWAAFILEGDAP
jgi:CHAT domain-containing protein